MNILINLIAALLFAALLIIPAIHYVWIGLPR